MPTCEGIITAKGLYYINEAGKEKWQKRFVGEWFKAVFSVLDRKIKDPKTREQLGLFWGLLLPKITEELQEQGHTVTLEVMPGIKRKTFYTQDMVYEGLTLACGLVGENGKGLRLSEMDKFQTNAFLTHVFEVAVELKMDVEKLKAVGKDLRK